MSIKKGSLAACSQCDRMTLVLDVEHHVCQRCQHPRAVDELLVLREGQSFRDWGRVHPLDPDDERVVLVDQFVAYLSTLKGQEIVRRWPWVWDGVEKIERELSGLTLAQVRARINQLLKKLSLARGKRHTVESSKSRQDGPYWQDLEMFGAMANTNEWHITDRDGASCQANEHEKQNTKTINVKENDQMSIYVKAPQAYELVERGEHPAKIASISEPEPSKFDPDKQSVKITFALSGGSFDGQLLSKYYTLSLSKMASLGKLYRVLVGKIDPGQRVDIEQLIGRDCAVQVTHKIGDDDEQYAAIQAVFAPAKNGKGSEKEQALAGANAEEVPF